MFCDLINNMILRKLLKIIKYSTEEGQINLSADTNWNNFKYPI
jgi:hypothetical protein